MQIYGGRAGYNFVSFTGERFQSLSRLKNREISTEVKLKKGSKKIIKILSKIPFVRSFSTILELIIENWKRFILVLIVLLLIEVSLNGMTNSYLLHTVNDIMKCPENDEIFCPHFDGNP
ncbi:hypothetical protein, partial [Bacillus sp. REN16]|uniref:hypothetical protein n=1 Tax=Bacillus sp. REN16 TaxID=2887296 RepID=UPI001E6499C4